MFQSLFKLRPYIRPYFWYIVTCILLAIPLSAIRLGPAPVVRYMLDDVIVKKDQSNLIWFTFAVVGIYFLNFFVRFTHYYLLRIVIIRVNQNIKNKIFQHLLGLSADYFTAQSTGTLISRTVADPQHIDVGLGCINMIIREPITLLFLVGYALKLNWRLTIVTFLVIPILAIVFVKTGSILKRYTVKISEISTLFYSILQESYTGIRTIKLFRLEAYTAKKFYQQNENYAKIFLKTAAVEEASHPLVELLTAFSLAPLIYYGGLQVIDGRMTTGDLFAFFTTFSMMINPVRTMNDINIKLSHAAAAIDRTQEILQWQSHIQESKDSQGLSKFKNSIDFKKVSFAYPDRPGQLVLKEVSFTVPHQKVIALVGASGAGKSSLVSLLPRLFDVQKGSIEIDGIDIRNFSIQDLRRQIAIVSQDIFLFNDTVEENIRCGRLNASLDEIQKATEQAHATDFIKKLPLGWQTIIGDRGQKLSGGERQRLSIARAFLSDAPILVLDEATSSLDTVSERAVQEALEELMVHRTTLIISHRLSTVQHADWIVVLEQGSIVEQGSHEDLLKLQGRYHQFHKSSQMT